MPLNRPTNLELIESVTEFLQNKIMPQVDKHSGFHTKVAINVLNIVAREINQQEEMESAEIKRLQSLLDSDASNLADLNQALCVQISEGEMPLDRTDLVTHLWECTKAKVAIDNPRYATYKQLTTDNTDA